jgi:hypothetical protein
MKVAGIIVIVFGALLALSSARLAFTQYNLRDTNDLSRFLGGATFSVVVLAIGLTMLTRSGKPPVS